MVAYSASGAVVPTIDERKPYFRGVFEAVGFANVTMRFVAIGIALVFIFAAAGKLANLSLFLSILRAYELLPLRLIKPFGLLIVISEAIVGTGLALDVFPPVAAYLAAALFLLFSSAVTISLLRGKRDLPCGCAAGTRRIGWDIVLRNIGLAGLALVSSGVLSLRSAWVFGLLIALSVAGRGTGKKFENRTELTKA